MTNAHPDLPAFYQAIRENPDDDGPLLIFADWLEENGDLDRAEFIRVQIELAQPALEGPRRVELRAKERLLLRSHASRWALPNLGPDLSWGPFEKGVARSILVRRPEALRFRMELILAAAPVHCVEMQYLISGGDLAVIQLVSQMRRIRELRILNQSRRFNYEGAICLSTFANLSELRKISLNGSFVGARGTRLMAHSSTMRRLRVLELNESKVGMTGIKALCETRYLEHLETLSLTHNQISPKIAAGFAGPVGLRSLRSLNLGNNDLADQGAAVLANAPLLGQLRTLNLESNRIGYNGIAALADSPYVRNLEELNLARNPFGGPAFARLAGSAQFASLTTLSVGQPRFTAREAAQLINSPYFPKLKTLVLANGSWAPDVIAILQHRFGAELRFEAGYRDFRGSY